MAASLSDAEARRQAEAEGLTLLRSESNATGFHGVYINSSGRGKPYLVQVRRGGKTVQLGRFATAEEAALAFARTPEGRAAAAAAAAAPAPLTAAEARRQAEAKGLTLLRSESNASGFQGVYIDSGKPKPYKAQVRRGGKLVHLGSFATAEEAALAVARTPEGTAAAAAAAAASAPPRAKSARGQITPTSGRTPAPKPDSPPRQLDALKQEAPPAWPDGAVEVKTEVKVEPSLKQEPPAMPDGAVVKEEAWSVEGPTNVQAAAGSSGVAQKRQRLGSA